MRTAIATVCLSGVLNEKLEAIAAAGFKGVEIFENDLLSFSVGSRRCPRDHAASAPSSSSSPSMRRAP
jgi:sugar phosphate isomerase/epimerase